MNILKRQAIGTLILYFSDKPNAISAKFPLYEGENIVGKDESKSDVVLNLKEISSTHCKITLNKFNEFSIEDLDSQFGVYKLNPNLPLEQKQKLKPGKEYELVENKPFYISKYKCIFLNKVEKGVENLINHQDVKNAKESEAGKKGTNKPQAIKKKNSEEESGDDSEYDPSPKKKTKKKSNENKKSNSPVKTDSPSIEDLFERNEFSLKKKQPAKGKRESTINEKLDPFISLQEEPPKKKDQSTKKDNKTGILNYLEELRRKYPSPSDKIFSATAVPSSLAVVEITQTKGVTTDLKEKTVTNISKTTGNMVSSSINAGNLASRDNEFDMERCFKPKANPKERSNSRVAETKKSKDEEPEPSVIEEEVKAKTRKGKATLQEDCLFSPIVSKNDRKLQSKMIVVPTTMVSIKPRNSLSKPDNIPKSDQKEKGNKRNFVTSLSDDEDFKIEEKKNEPKKKLKVPTIRFSNPIIPTKQKSKAQQEKKETAIIILDDEKGKEKEKDKPIKKEKGGSSKVNTRGGTEEKEKILEVTPVKKEKKGRAKDNDESSTRHTSSSEKSPKPSNKSPKISKNSKKIKKIIKHTPGQKLIKRADYYLRKRGQFKVMFSGFRPTALVRDSLAKLGAHITEDRTKSIDVLVLEKNFRRTIKVLIAIAKGAQIVTTKWVNDSISNIQLQDLSNYSLNDAAAQKGFDFDLKKSIERARKNGGLFKDFTFFVSPDIKPDENDVSLIIKAMGGKILSNKNSLESGNLNNIIVVNGETDKNIIEKLKEKNVRICSEEFVLSGCLRQTVELEKYSLWPNKK